MLTATSFPFLDAFGLLALIICALVVWYILSGVGCLRLSEVAHSDSNGIRDQTEIALVA